MLGLEPLYLACEGRMVIMAPKAEAEKIVEVLHKCPYSQNAAIIGEVTAEQPGESSHDYRNRNAGTSSTAGRRIAATYLLNNLKCGIGDISKKKGDFSWTPE